MAPVRVPSTERVLAAGRHRIRADRRAQCVIVQLVDDHSRYALASHVASSETTNVEGEILLEHSRPASGVTYVGHGRPRGPHPKTPQTSPKS